MLLNSQLNYYLQISITTVSCLLEIYFFLNINLLIEYSFRDLRYLYRKEGYGVFFDFYLYLS